jgi:hypothetical protein
VEEVVVVIIPEMQVLMEDQLVVLVVVVHIMLAVVQDLLVQHKVEIPVVDILVLAILIELVEAVEQAVLELLDQQEKVEMDILIIFWELTIIGLLVVAVVVNPAVMEEMVDLVVEEEELRIMVH